MLSVAVLVLVVGTMWFLQQTRGEDSPASNPNRDGSSNEIELFRALSDGYHEGLTIFGSAQLSAGRTLDREGLAIALGTPEGCSSDPIKPVQTRQMTLDGGQLHWLVGEVLCDDIVLPWEAVVGIPREPAPKGVLVIVHGTAGSPEQLFGVETGAYHPDYMKQSGLSGLADGFVVIAPRILTDLVYDDQSAYNRLRNEVDQRAQALGLRLFGMEQVALSHTLLSITHELALRDLPQIIYGVSLGGAVAFYQAALNPEIDGVIVSQWSEDRFEKLASPTYPYALWRYEIVDYSITLGSALNRRDRFVAKLIFPRPLGIEVGVEDPRAEAMLPLVEALSDLYSAYPERFQVTVNEGGHEMLYNPAVDKLWKEVGQP